jgi:hypothetical protein
MVVESLKSALQSLKAQRQWYDNAIAAIEGLLAGGGAPQVANAAEEVKRATRKARVGRPKRKNAPRGLLRQKMYEILKGAKKPLAPVELRNALMKAGYPAKNEKTLYSSIFAAVKKDTRLKKTAAGFSLK